MTSSNPSNSAPLRVAVVGSGIGRSHLAAFKALPDLFEIAAVCDIDPSRAAALAETFGVSQTIGSLDELCTMQDLDVIDICTPAHLHVDHILQVLAAGKHAICEKPIAASLASLDRLIEAQESSGRRVMPIFNYRFGAGVQKLRRLIAQGLAGRAYLGTIEVAWRRRAAYYDVPWRGHWATELGGSLTSHAIHHLDLLMYVLGPVANVFARTATMVNPIEVEDCASISLQMASGALASVSVTLGSSVEISRQRYCFANLVAESNLAPYAANAAEPWQFVGDTPELQAQLDAALAASTSDPDGFEGQFARFYAALHGNAEYPVTLADARRATELLTATYASARSCAPVDLPVSRNHPLYESWLP
jgi:predicted dehydrogenase